MTATRIRESAPGEAVAPTADTVLWLLHDTVRLLCKRYDRELRTRLPGMTRARAAALAHLARQEGVCQTRLAECLDIEPMTLVRLLDALERLGWIERRPGHDDRRMRLLHLTGVGRAMLAEIRAGERAVLSHVSVGINPAHRAELIMMLMKVRENLARGGADPAPGRHDV